MAQKGYISEFMNGGRIVSHGKINDLSNGFKLPGDVPFSFMSDRNPAHRRLTRSCPCGALRTSSYRKHPSCSTTGRRWLLWNSPPIRKSLRRTTSIGEADVTWRVRYDCITVPLPVEAHTGVDFLCPAQEEEKPANGHGYIGYAHQERR